MRFIKIKTENDRSGHPRRAWICTDQHNNVLSVFDEGYAGINAVPEDHRDSARHCLELVVKPSEYRKWIKLGRDLESLSA